MKKACLYSLLALSVSAACHAETFPAPIGPSQSDFGGVGLLQTPTARMARDGEFSSKPRCAIPTYVPKRTAAWMPSPARKPTKIKPST